MLFKGLTKRNDYFLLANYNDWLRGGDILSLSIYII